MANWGQLTGKVRSRVQKFRAALKPIISRVPTGISESIAGASIVVSAAKKFLTSFGEKTSDLNRISMQKLESQDSVSRLKMKERAIAELTARTKEDIRQTVEKYSRGSLTSDQLRTNIQGILRVSTLAAATIGVGGVGNLTENVLTAVQRQLSNQFRLLDGFINELQTRDITQRDRARFLQYASSLHSISQTANRQFTLDTYGDPSNLEERRVLGGAEHCEDCLELAAEGWSPFGSLPPIGSDTVCGNNCQCSIVTRMKSSLDDQNQPVPGSEG